MDTITNLPWPHLGAASTVDVPGFYRGADNAFPSCPMGRFHEAMNATPSTRKTVDRNPVDHPEFARLAAINKLLK